MITLDANACYEAMRTRDSRFDGAFYVGVSSTGIYCRTICPVKTPKRENCSFYPSAAAAERAGYRPCLRCRPELAPGGIARVDAVDRLAGEAFRRIEDGALGIEGAGSVPELAAELGVSDRHLRRVVEQTFGVSPVELAQTQRLLLAKRLLTDTDLPITEVAFASGFGSLRRFNALFIERYRLNPTDLRKVCGTTSVRDTLCCEVTYRPPLDWEALLSFLNGRTLTGVESVEQNRYLRTVSWKDRAGWVSVQPTRGRDALTVELSASLAPALLPILVRVKRLFDLYADPLPIVERLGSLAAAHPGLRVPGAFDGFEMAVRAILGQQVSVKAAATLAGRLAGAFGEPLETPFPTLNRRTPPAQRLARAETAEITALGVIGARAESIRALAEAVAEGKIRLEPGVDVEATMAKLQELPGIGEWTAQYIALRALAWPDAFPHADLGIRKALGGETPKQVLARAEAWRPWRSYAALHLWKSLEETK